MCSGSHGWKGTELGLEPSWVWVQTEPESCTMTHCELIAFTSVFLSRRDGLLKPPLGATRWQRRKGQALVIFLPLLFFFPWPGPISIVRSSWIKIRTTAIVWGHCQLDLGKLPSKLTLLPSWLSRPAQMRWLHPHPIPEPEFPYTCQSRHGLEMVIIITMRWVHNMN